MLRSIVGSGGLAVVGIAQRKVAYSSTVTRRPGRQILISSARPVDNPNPGASASDLTTRKCGLARTRPRTDDCSTAAPGSANHTIQLAVVPTGKRIGLDACTGVPRRFDCIRSQAITNGRLLRQTKVMYTTRAERIDAWKRHGHGKQDPGKAFHDPLLNQIFLHRIRH